VSGEGVVAVALVMALGVVGTVVPLVPGLGLIWAAGLVYGLLDGFGVVGAMAFTVMTLLVAGGTVAKYVLPSRGGAGRGASRTTLLAGAGCGLIGFFVLPVLGLPLGAVLGVLLAERQRTQDWSAAWYRTRGVIVGFGIGALVEFAAALAMVLVWVGWVLGG
jgi:uncharacterized protein YqgC (DUF456 family)